MVGLAGYSNHAGIRTTSAPAEVSTPDGKCRLLMFAHPRCPCTKASISELARIMVNASDKVDATVYFFQPRTSQEHWTTGELWESAAAIPGVRVEADPGGAAAKQFGSTTSGDVLLYDASGRLQFQGGITASRGHEGDNLGKSTVMSILRGDRANVDHSPVFGCEIHSAAAGRNE
jgi:hypothetical protein